jgi:hypothetical protein
MEKEIKDLALQIAEELKNNHNPHVTIVINSEGIKMTSVDYFEPTEVNIKN